MRPIILRLLSIALCLAALLAVAPAGAQNLDPDKQVSFDIPPQTFETALLQLAKQASLQLAISTPSLPAGTSPRVSGTMPIRAAVGHLLSGTALSYEFVGARTLTIVSKEMSESASMQDPSRNQTQLARVDGPSQSTPPSQESAAPTASVQINEIVVTAQKRSERLQDVPVPVTVLSAEALVETNQLRLQDYYTRIPGLNVTPGRFSRSPQVTIRGVSTGFGTSPTVSILVDDVPLSSSTALAAGQEMPDIDPSELKRIEVLRGPQGTLYGASSLGGLLKYVTSDPSTDGVSGQVQAGMSSVHNGDELGYSMRGAVNVPLGKTLAMRISGFTRRDPGYIDNVQTGQRGVNRADVDGGRLSALWRPSEALSLKLGAMFQDGKSDGSSDVGPLAGLGDLQQRHLQGTGYLGRKFQAYEAVLTTQLRGAELTVLSGYSVNTLSFNNDYTFAFAATANAFFPGASAASFPADLKNKKFSQEIRLSTSIGDRLEWLLGGFYTRESVLNFSRLLANNPVTGATVGELYHIGEPSTYAEDAFFTDLTVHIAPRFDVQFGARASQNRQTYSNAQSGPFVGVQSVPQRRSKDNASTYLVTPRFRVSPELMIYARAASGYRPGGPNLSVPVGLPTSFEADTTQNFEIGVKGEAFNRLISFDSSLYYISWKDIQLRLSGVDFSYFANAGRAKSQGVEFSVELKPLTGLAIAAWVAWNDAVLTENFPAASTAYGVSGDRLPDGSRFSGNFSLDQEFPMGAMTGSVGASVGYIGDREGGLTASPVREVYPAYAKTDLRAALRFDAWTANVYVNNLADKRVALTGGRGTVNPLFFNYIQPRTIGMSLSRSF